MSTVHKLLVATDFSDGADHALDYGIDLARALAVPMLLVHVYAPPVIITPDGAATFPVDLARVHADLEAGLARRAALARDHGVATVETAIGNGVPWREILRLAHEGDCDLIVMGTHGRGGLAHLLLGSVAEKVVRRAECAVLTVGKRAPAVQP
jgi:nucleotide-binding universal stress UspA family protein